MRVVLLFSHSVHFCQIRKLSYLHNFITNLSTYFSVVILEKQPTPTKNWFWVQSRPPNPTFVPSQSGGPVGVWLHLSTVVFAWWLESKLDEKENCYLSLIVIKVWGNELSSVLIVLLDATENEGVFLKYQSLKSVYFWFRLDAPAVSRSQGKFLIGPRLGLIYILQYSWIFFTSVILNWRLILHGSYALLSFK